MSDTRPIRSAIRRALEGTHIEDGTISAFDATVDAVEREIMTELISAAQPVAAAAEDELLALHRQLAAEKLRADEGWQRAEAKSKECTELREVLARLSTRAAPVTASTDALMSELTEQLGFIAQGWDGCKYDAVGEMLDVGACLRQSFASLPAYLRTVTAPVGQSPAPVTATGDLHNAIMNLPCKKARADFEEDIDFIAYKEGHRDARHAAAELVAAAASEAAPVTAEPVATAPKEVPEGWPTNAMITAGFNAGLYGRLGSGFRAMLAAAPTSGSVELVDCGTCGCQVSVPVEHFAAPVSPQPAAQVKGESHG